MALLSRRVAVSYWHIASVSAVQRHVGSWGRTGSNRTTVKMALRTHLGHRARRAEADMAGDLSGVVAQPYPTIERDRAEPDRTAICSLFENQPQADVVSLVSASAIWLFEG